MAKLVLSPVLRPASWIKQAGAQDKSIGLGDALKRLNALVESIDLDLLDTAGLATAVEVEARLGQLEAALKKQIKAVIDHAAAVAALAKKCATDYKTKPDNGKEIAAAAAQVGDAATDYAGKLRTSGETAHTELKNLLVKFQASEKKAKGAAAAPKASGELSGSKWVAKFPTSRSTADLSSSFASSVDRFIAAIKVGGGSVTIAATLRPVERAFLMHYAFKISKKQINPDKVPKLNGVDINWVHPTSAESIKAAQEMVNGYDIAYEPALKSRHTEGRAIDMTITGIVGKSMKDAKNQDVAIKNAGELHKVGASYGVIKLASDPPHWSDDGH